MYRKLAAYIVAILAVAAIAIGPALMTPTSASADGGAATSDTANTSQPADTAATTETTDTPSATNTPATTDTPESDTPESGDVDEMDAPADTATVGGTGSAQHGLYKWTYTPQTVAQGQTVTITGLKMVHVASTPTFSLDGTVVSSHRKLTPFGLSYGTTFTVGCDVTPGEHQLSGVSYDLLHVGHDLGSGTLTVVAGRDCTTPKMSVGTLGADSTLPVTVTDAVPGDQVSVTVNGITGTGTVGEDGTALVKLPVDCTMPSGSYTAQATLSGAPGVDGEQKVSTTFTFTQSQACAPAMAVDRQVADQGDTIHITVSNVLKTDAVSIHAGETPIAGTWKDGVFTADWATTCDVAASAYPITATVARDGDAVTVANGDGSTAVVLGAGFECKSTTGGTTTGGSTTGGTSSSKTPSDSELEALMGTATTPHATQTLASGGANPFSTMSSSKAKLAKTGSVALFSALMAVILAVGGWVLSHYGREYEQRRAAYEATLEERRRQMREQK